MGLTDTELFLKLGAPHTHTYNILYNVYMLYLYYIYMYSIMKMMTEDDIVTSKQNHGFWWFCEAVAEHVHVPNPPRYEECKAEIQEALEGLPKDLNVFQHLSAAELCVSISAARSCAFLL